MIENAVMARAVRTMINGFTGALAEVPATVLGSAVIRAARERSDVAVDQVDEVNMGNLLTVDLEQNPARQAGQ